MSESGLPDAAPGLGAGPSDGLRDADELDYEQARDELAAVVQTLETGGLSLDESVALWERGEQLARRCTAQLAGARERVEAVLHGAEGGDPPPNGGAPAG